MAGLQGKSVVVTGAGSGIGRAAAFAFARDSARVAVECGPDSIRVNALLPGQTDTKFASALTSNEEVLNTWLKQIPLRRHAQPSEMAGAVLYLVSDASGFATAACVTVDGGYLL